MTSVSGRPCPGLSEARLSFRPGQVVESEDGGDVNGDTVADIDNDPPFAITARFVEVVCNFPT